MDPNQTLSDLLYLLSEGDRDAALIALDALGDWIAKGGFLPEVKRTDHRNWWIGTPK